MEPPFKYRFPYLIRIKSIFVLSIIFCCFNSLEAQIVINEISSDNQSLIPDEDGDYNDWIEIYNSGASPVDLAGYSLVDNTPVASQWIFPSYILVPGGHLLVFASEKDRKELIHHWETAVQENDTWRYLVPTSEPSSNWRLASFDDAAWLSGKGGIGYGDGDDSTLLSAPLNALYLRKTFTIADTSKIMKAILHMDYDDGFVAYLNGVEVGRSTNITGTPPGYQSQATVEHEALVYNGGVYEEFSIDKALLETALVNGVNVLSVQVHNLNPFSSDLTARINLSFGMIDAGSQFSAPPSWFNEPNASFHTNFKISSLGDETVYLFDNNSILTEQKLVPVMNIDHAYGRTTDGGGSWTFFNSPTPAAANNTGQAFTGYCNDQLLFSIDGGFYPSAQTVSISGASSIRYTTDGSVPTLSSPLYSSPLNITSTTVVRAACMDVNLWPKEVFTNTYIINENTTLPVVSISTNPENFFDDNIGIYMLGPNADSNNIPYFGANFWQDWERPVHVEFFDKQKNLGFEQEAGVKIFGNYSRSNPMKSLWIKAHDRYGKDQIDYKFFADKNIDSFKEIILRNSGNDFNVTHIKDVTNQMAVFKKTDIDIQAYEPCVVYINGQYWGVHQIREKINEHYIEQNYAIDKDSIDVLDTWGGALHGESNFWEIWWWANYLDLSDVTNFKAIADSFDLDNMIDYFALEIYISNWDWPQNNLKQWRRRTGDRKLRYLLYDTDITQGIWDLQPASFNQMGRIKNATGLIGPGPHAEIFNRMLHYIPFRNAFINRSADLMNTIFTPADFSALAYRLRDSIAPEMPKHFTRWGSNVSNWNWNISNMVDFMYERPAYARNQIESEFGLVKQVDVTLNVSPAGAGVIKINTIYPETYPWTGVYFDGVPVTITAIPNPGYTFSHWQSPNLIPTPNSNRSVTLNVNLDQAFTAYFTGSASTLDLVISEINYNSDNDKESGDWFEIHNRGNSAVDISNWKFQDYQDYNYFVFPENTMISAGGYLVVCSDLSLFQSAYPSVTNVIGSFGFGLGNEGDMLRLFNYKNDLIFSFSYGYISPWPTGADGGGYTLERIEGAADANDPSSWFEGCLFGSPGTAFDPACVLSVDQQAENSLIRIYPNPSKGIFNLRLSDSGSEKVSYMVINPTGQKIKTGMLNKSVGASDMLDLSGFPSGLYSIVFTTASGVQTEHIVIAE